MTDAGGMIFANISSGPTAFGFPFAGEGICGFNDPNSIPSGTACTFFLSERRLTDGAFIMGSPASYMGSPASYTGYTGPPVPLPAALPLFGSALAMLGIVGWRRKRRAAA